MIKFILHGGFAPHEKQVDDAFFAEILKDAPRAPTILLVYFAKEADRILKNKEEDIEQFENQKGSKVLSFVVADEQNFLDQVKHADIVYFHGGDSLKLLGVLKQYSDLKNMLEGRIVAGDSAGVNVFTKMFYSPKADVVREGFGIIPVKLIPHYKEEYVHKMDNTPGDFEVVRLSEYETKTLDL